MAKRKGSGALHWITTEAKRLRREFPKRFATWREYVAQASAIYASKHKGKSPVGHKHKRKKVSGMATRHKRKRTALARAKAYHRKEGAALRSLGAVRSHVSKATKHLEKVIGELEVRRFKAKKKALKKKIGKQIREKKTMYRHLKIA